MKLLFALLLALATTPLVARPAADDSAPKRAKKAPDPNKRVCRFAADTGSHIPQSICHTQAQWDAIDQANAAAATEMMRQRRPSQQ